METEARISSKWELWLLIIITSKLFVLYGQHRSAPRLSATSRQLTATKWMATIKTTLQIQSKLGLPSEQEWLIS